MFLCELDEGPSLLGWCFSIHNIDGDAVCGSLDLPLADSVTITARERMVQDEGERGVDGGGRLWVVVVGCGGYGGGGGGGGWKGETLLARSVEAAAV